MKTSSMIKCNFFSTIAHAVQVLSMTSSDSSSNLSCKDKNQTPLHVIPVIIINDLQHNNIKGGGGCPIIIMGLILILHVCSVEDPLDHLAKGPISGPPVAAFHFLSTNNICRDRNERPIPKGTMLPSVDTYHQL